MKPTRSRRIDLNADLGEGFGVWRAGDDASLIEVVTTANVACGAHAGDPLILLETARLAAKAKVGFGAHVSYFDLVGFGRRSIPLTAEELRAGVLYQLGAAWAAARAAGIRLGHIKAHGALYWDSQSKPEVAEALIEAVCAFGEDLVLITYPHGAALEAALAKGIRVAKEGFADRRYGPDGMLLRRGNPQALIEDPAEARTQAVSLALHGEALASDGSRIRVEVDSICVHSDTKGAVEIARAVREGLVSAGLVLAPIAA
jgi:UPF0271 protein